MNLFRNHPVVVKLLSTPVRKGVFMIIGVGTVFSAVANSSIQTFEPTERATPVLNPGKGWISYAKPDKASAEEVALASVGYDRFEWGAIQPRSPKQFKWEIIDNFIQKWTAHGKQVAFGVMTSNSHSPAKNGYVTPQWVYQAGVKAKIHVLKQGVDQMDGSPGPKRDPQDFNDPKFLELLEDFVKSLAERYDGDRRIAFIDVRSFGNWGESFDERHLEMHQKYFHKTRLCQSIQNAAWTEKVAKSGVAIRRDGIGGSQGEEVAPAFGYSPGVFEFWGPLAYLEKRGWWKNGRLLEESIEIGKPTYVEIVRESPGFIPAHRQLIDRSTNRIGFHFVLKKIQFSSEIQVRGTNQAVLDWINQGVAPIYSPCTVAFALIDSHNKVADVSVPKNSFPADWMPGKLSTETVSFTFNRATPAQYTLALGLLYDPSDTEPSYLLGIDTPMCGKWHLLGKIALR